MIFICKREATKKLRASFRCVQIFNKSTWVSLFFSRTRGGRKMFFFYKKSLFSFCFIYWIQGIIICDGVIKNHDGVTFFITMKAMCLLCCFHFSPCAAFNGLLFVLGMLIKIKNHLGNKKLVVGLHMKRYSINNSCSCIMSHIMPFIRCVLLQFIQFNSVEELFMIFCALCVGTL